MNLTEKDIEHLWHPYTDIDGIRERPFPVMVSGEGTRLTDSRGKTYYDGISSWWCVNLGHSRPEIVNAIAEQSRRLQHSITGGLSHEPVIELAARLAGITPRGLGRTYFASDGASAVEAAIRMAVQYWWNLGRPEKRNIVSIEGGYHGDTLGAVGLGFLEKFHAPVEHIVNRSLQAPSPHCFHCPLGLKPETCSTECFAGMEKTIWENAGSTAAVIAEPVCQGASGIRIYPAGYVAKLRRLCTENEVLLILDEIAVGFGRTGSMFASELAGVSPDILVLGKSLTGGYLPMSAAVVTDEIYDSFRSERGRDRTFYHGHTFSGNPLASAAAAAAIDVFQTGEVLSGNRPSAILLAEAFREFSSLPGVHRTSSTGWMTSLEIEAEAGGAQVCARAAETALERGLLIRPLGSVLYLWPPLVTTTAEMEEMLAIFGDSLRIALNGRKP